MGADNAITMEQSECNDLLDATETGVISLSTASDEPPHSIPVSFGYDPVESVLYFRLAADSDSEKGELTGRQVSFVTHDQLDGDWASVVASGTLERTTDEDIQLETLEGLERVTIPLVDIFGSPTRDVDFEFFRLVPDSFSGRKEAPMGP